MPTSSCRDLLLTFSAAFVVATASSAQQTPPVTPNLTQTPIPPAVQLPAPPGGSALPSRPITADEAARIALKNQPDIAAAVAGVTTAQGRNQQAKSGLLPTVSVSGSLNHVHSFSGDIAGGSGGIGGSGGTTGGFFGATQGYQTSASVRQLLFDFDRTRNLVRQAGSNERAADAGISRAQADVVLSVKQAFYNYVQNQRLVEVNESNLKSQQARLDLAQARLKAGLGPPPDVVRAQTAVADAILNLSLARNNASVSRVRLAQLMGIDPRTPIETSDAHEADVSAVDFNAMVTAALKQRPETVQAQASLKAAEFGRTAAKTGDAPSISANGFLSARGNALPPRSSFAAVGASVQWDPFDSGLTAGKVKEAQGFIDAAKAALRSAELAVTSDVAQAYLTLKTAEQRVTTAAAEVANAQETVRLAEGRYRAGVGTFIDVTDAQSALVTARTNQVNAVSAVDQARAALARAIGAGVPR